MTEIAVDAKDVNSLVVLGCGAAAHSADGGITWNIEPIEPADFAPTSRIQFDPQYNGVFYVASNYPQEGIYQASDFGASFEQIFSWRHASRQLAINAEGRLFTGATYHHALPNQSPDPKYDVSTIYSSTANNVTQWSHSLSVRTATNVIAILVVPLAQETIFVAMLNKGLYMSKDGGSSWVESNQGVTEHDVPGVMELAYDPRNPQVIYRASAGGIPMYKSTDGGTSWTAIQ
jgi:photosystem II stability/assembly factor-like uncharacterized protein